MAANISQRKMQSIAVASEVGKFADWFLVADCSGPCGPRALTLKSMPCDLTIMRLLMRMRCHACGGQVKAAALDNAARGHLRRMVRIWGRAATGDPAKSGQCQRPGERPAKC